jgi:uncharacterized protein (DUF1919 family)
VLGLYLAFAKIKDWAMIADFPKKVQGYVRFVNKRLLDAAEFMYRFIQRKRLHNKDFTIISNNCWGGGVYEDLGQKYNSPTIGLFFFAPCYFEFLKNLKSNLSEEISFVSDSKYPKARELQEKQSYPIGTLGGSIEIHFLHYHSCDEARDKWNRRRLRVNYDNLFLSFSDSEGYDLDGLEFFDSLPFSKVFFTAKPNLPVRSCIWLKGYKNQPHVGDIYSNRWSYRFFFDVVRWLNKRP